MDLVGDRSAAAAFSNSLCPGASTPAALPPQHTILSNNACMCFCNCGQDIPSNPNLQANEGNRLVELRSNAGTHDVEFGLKAIADLKACRDPEHTASIPRYDKSAHEGKGTRSDPSTWPHVHGPVDVILFEGWMLGFEPVRTPSCGPANIGHKCQYVCSLPACMALTLAVGRLKIILACIVQHHAEQPECRLG